ncbi:DUF1934 domain-containing protein [Paenibacillus puerhi]|uniref:DUF1934 domain-containing protein n=1 Tax=Paenibacillus puerhi TaxID=2692622 RepID=UPI00135CD4CC|nr:DUF1934 domain-containing protein [Paenibacillus puerhi]
MNGSSQSETGSGKTDVRVRLLSVTSGERIAMEMRGVLFPKAGGFYVRYEEPEEAQMGRTTTTVRLLPDEVRILRRGDVRFEQTFAAGGRHIGYIETAHGRMELETVTHGVELRKPADGRMTPLEATWRYDLTLMGEAAGQVEVKLEISAGEEG